MHDYKTRTYGTEQQIRPDYYCRRHVITRPEDDLWIHYLSHELIGLTAEEKQKYYLSRDPSLEEALRPL